MPAVSADWAHRERFDALVEAVLADLPPQPAAWLEEVPVVVDDEVPEALARELATAWAAEDGRAADAEDLASARGLLGLYDGRCLTEQSIEVDAEPTPVVRLFRGPQESQRL